MNTTTEIKTPRIQNCYWCGAKNVSNFYFPKYERSFDACDNCRRANEKTRAVQRRRLLAGEWTGANF